MAENSGPTGPSERDLRDNIPQATGAHDLRVGIFVLVGLISVMVSLFLLTDPAMFRGRYLVTSVVDNAGGLRRGDPVQMLGVNIGRVHRFTIDQSGVTITLEIEGEWQVPEDSRTELISAGFLGGRIVVVVPGQSPNPARNGQELPGRMVQSLFDVPDELGDKAESIMGQIEALLADTTVASLQEGAIHMEEFLEELSGIAAEQRSELASLTASLRRAAEGIEGTSSQAGPQITSAIARADSVMLQLNETTATLDEAASSLSTILGRIERGEGTLGQLSVNDSLYVNLNETLASARTLLEDFRQNPGRYINISIF